jgi:hypothetical protein
VARERSPAELIAAAPDRMVALRTARVFVADGFRSPVASEHEEFGAGVADFVRRRVRGKRPLLSLAFAEAWPLRGRGRRRSPGIRLVRAGMRWMARRRSPYYFDGGLEYRHMLKRWGVVSTTDRDGPRRYGDPTWLLDVLPTVMGEVVVAGSETVRDTPTTRYAFVVDLRHAASAAPGELVLPPFVDREGGARYLDVEVWLGPTGEVRRMSHAVPDRMRDRLMWNIVEFSDFGAPVAIVPPQDVIRPD